MLTDIEIAKSVKMRPINEVAAELGIHEDQVENYGRYIAKITTDKIDTNKFKNHHLILVTAISPTKAGNGKTTVSVGLASGHAEDWQEVSRSLARTISRSMLRHEGWRSRWRLCPGRTNG